MPVISGNSSVAANTQSANLLAGDNFEFIGNPSEVRLYLSGSAAGFQADFLVGGIAHAQNAVVPATNRFPLREEDGIAGVGALPGERLFLSVLNTTGGALTINWLVDIVELG